MEHKGTEGLRTWVEIDTGLLRQNFLRLQKLIGPRCRFMAVVKSNAYGHGLVPVAKQLANAKHEAINPKSLWFGVDSVVEALRLREEGIKNPVLVFGSTLAERMHEAADNHITLTISNFDALASLSKLSERPEFHLKIDTGMHRQGFMPGDTARLVKCLKRSGLSPAGIYTHFAAAKDRAYPTITFRQFKNFNDVLGKLKRVGFSAKGAVPAGPRGSSPVGRHGVSGGKNFIRHAAASGGTILFPETHLDMVRVGMALWGHWPSEEARLNVVSRMFDLPSLELRPILSWKTRIAEIKEIPAGASIGYDLTERVTRKSAVAVLPVGYWHGLDRGLSSIGSVLVRGGRAKILGRVSMDMIVVDITDINNKVKSQKLKVKTGEEVVLIGKQGQVEVTAEEMARLIGTSPYEVLTRINPLIERIYR
ncbi:MAG: alanine racemase [Candidatus Sungbacteria bacterium]|nr:alanine racemase [Candidatus Sungbacteria bacterium]